MDLFKRAVDEDVAHPGKIPQTKPEEEGLEAFWCVIQQADSPEKPRSGPIFLKNFRLKLGQLSYQKSSS